MTADENETPIAPPGSTVGESTDAAVHVHDRFCSQCGRAKAEDPNSRPRYHLLASWYLRAFVAFCGLLLIFAPAVTIAIFTAMRVSAGFAILALVLLAISRNQP